jgi:Family of unknown function (DUF6515)
MITFMVILISSIFLVHETQAQRRGRTYHSVVVRRAHVRYATLPRWGTVVSVRPAGAVVIGRRRHPYYFQEGIFYAPRKGGYAIVRPARGIRIRALPIGYRTVIVGPRTYYYYYGTYYSKADNSNEYDVVDPPEGAVVDALPDGYDVKTVANTEYYFFDGVYYAEVDAPEFEDGVGYEVVKV